MTDLSIDAQISFANLFAEVLYSQSGEEAAEIRAAFEADWEAESLSELTR